MADSNISHDVEGRLRNIETQMGIGKVDEETGEYTVTTPETPEEPTEPTEPDEDTSVL